MNPPKIAVVPIAEIRVVNPRFRNRTTFQAIKANIERIGLKKPITVHQRARAEDGTQYDLICGQGRLESVRDLGDTTIPAIINDAPEDERYLMSLVENLARRPPSTAELVREVKRLTAQQHNPATIAAKLGLEKNHVHGIVKLLRNGEEDLVRRVEAGRLPVETAIQIATGTHGDIQRALSEAYESGTLRARNCALPSSSLRSGKERRRWRKASARSRGRISCVHTNITRNSSGRLCAGPLSSLSGSRFSHRRRGGGWPTNISLLCSAQKDCRHFLRSWPSAWQRQRTNN